MHPGVCALLTTTFQRETQDNNHLSARQTSEVPAKNTANLSEKEKCRMPNPYFPKLFELGQIGKVRLKNRIIEGPWERHFPGPFGEVTDRTIDYLERAKGGVGL